MPELTLEEHGIEIAERRGHFFVRYDAGGHITQWREDEISEEEARSLRAGDATQREQVLLKLQRRLELAGTDPYRSNWDPSHR